MKILSLVLVGISLVVSQNASGSKLTFDEKSEFEVELRSSELSKVKGRLDKIAAEAIGEGTKQFKLCRTFLEFQASDEWRPYSDTLNSVMREELDGMKNGLPSYLRKSQTMEADQLVLMGKLYEKFLEDKNAAKTCYERVVKRLFDSRTIPEDYESWSIVLDKLRERDDLTANERHALKRLDQYKSHPSMIMVRVRAAQEIELAEIERELLPDQPVVETDHGAELEEARRRYSEEGGLK